MTDYTTPPPPPPPPMGQPPLQPAGGKDNSQLIGIIGIVTGLFCCLFGIGLGIWSLMEAKKKGGNPLWGYLSIGAGVLSVIIGSVYQASQ